MNAATHAPITKRIAPVAKIKPKKRAISRIPQEPFRYGTDASAGGARSRLTSAPPNPRLIRSDPILSGVVGFFCVELRAPPAPEPHPNSVRRGDSIRRHAD